MVAGPDGVGAVVDILFLPAAHADEADYDVIVVWEYGIVAEGYSGGGGGLPGDGRVGADHEVGLEVDLAADVEDDGLLVVPLDGLPE